MAHINDLKAAREAAERLSDPYDRSSVLAEVAKASALTDIASALEDIARSDRDRLSA